MRERPAFKLRFADDGVLELGAQTRVMGVLNVTPDSFSDGGRYVTPEAAAERALEMIDAGADLIDLGGESTRPGAAPVSATEEIRRVVPAVESIRARSPVRISVDTMKTAVAAAALDAGADMVNDVGALGDEGMLDLVAARRVPAILMHMRGRPRTMQRDTRYADVVADVAAFLGDRAASAVAGGISGDRIVIDPGIGFGKSTAGNSTLLRDLSRLQTLGHPILIGASRKTFLGKILDVGVDERLEAGLAVAAYAASQGAHIVRTHDVLATVRTVRTIDALRQG